MSERLCIQKNSKNCCNFQRRVLSVKKAKCYNERVYVLVIGHNEQNSAATQFDFVLNLLLILDLRLQRWLDVALQIPHVCKSGLHVQHEASC